MSVSAEMTGNPFASLCEPVDIRHQGLRKSPTVDTGFESNRSIERRLANTTVCRKLAGRVCFMLARDEK